MTKRISKPATPPPDAKPSPDDVTGEGMDVIAFSIRHLKAKISAIASGTDPEESKHDPSSRIAFLAKHVGGLMDIARKERKDQNRRVGELTLTQVVGWLRQQDKETQGRVARELHNFERKGGVLG